MTRMLHPHAGWPTYVPFALLALAALVLGAILTLRAPSEAISPPDVAGVVVTPARSAVPLCRDFPSQAAAQAAYRSDPARYRRLDGDGDAVACERNPPPYDHTPVPVPLEVPR